MQELLALLHTEDDGLRNMKRVIPVGNFNGHVRYEDVGFGEKRKMLVMGILNVTPDSFSDGGKYNNVDAAVAEAISMIQDGADIIDIGGESTRPGATEVSIEDEISRTIPVIKALRAKGINSIISIDTRKSSVARLAVENGANIVNDVSGGKFDSAMLSTVAELGVPVILMHMRGTPVTMSSLSTYSPNGAHNSSIAVVDQVITELAEQLKKADRAGIPRWCQIVDPGIGFAKEMDHNLSLLQPNNLRRITKMLCGRPMLVGVSRKRFIGKILDDRKSLISGDNINLEVDIESKDWGTAGACCAAVLGGSNFIRVHNVKGVRAACDVFNRIIEGE